MPPKQKLKIDGDPARPVTIKYTSICKDTQGRSQQFAFDDIVPAGALAGLLAEAKSGAAAPALMSIAHSHSPAILAAKPWVCSAREEICSEPATNLVCSPALYPAHAGSGPMVADLCCVPVCGDPVCETTAKQMSQMLFKGVSDEMRQEEGRQGAPALYDAKLRMCAACGAGAVKNATTLANAAAKAKLVVCARCKSVYYCGRDCQKAHWKVHKRGCVEPLNAFRLPQ